MSVLLWDQLGEKYYETGVNKGVLYPQIADGSYPAGYAWSGLTAITESPSGAEPTALYADNVKYLNLLSLEEYAATIECYFYPDEFKECNGEAALSTGVNIGQQTRKPFGFSWQTRLGNDTLGVDYGYIIHIVYNALAAPTDKNYESINDSPDAMTISYEISTTPVPVTGQKPTASLTIDSTKVDPADLALIEAALYGTTDTAAYLPTPDEILALITP